MGKRGRGYGAVCWRPDGRLEAGDAQSNVLQTKVKARVCTMRTGGISV